ncbi:CoA transferase [Microbacterium sp. H1-D42]|uniref:CaiB/BaiF CoA transferase family protein n=1 Tax=Microbacterium sp. H1-D42 TaxID=2925844 RepID=UPI001F53096C|nr:CoA transferase [Microbacterium sp. H1-D42]UNK71903.1 CoA transferase [Microbacterium sp. H1-D42]
MSAQPLQGVRVIDFGQFIAAPAATQMLADMGAEVIKIESPSGDAARSIGVHGEAMINAFNRGKRSIVLDLKSDEGLDIAKRLIASADIVVQNMRPGVMASFGLDGPTLLAAHPHLVYAGISAFGTTGPSKMRAGLDITAQAESGLMHMTGEPDRDPQKVGAQIVDAATAYAAAAAVLGAYISRLRTGRGDIVETSLLEVAMHMQAPMIGAFLANGVEPKRVGSGQPTVAPAADIITTADGAFILSAYSQAHFARLCTLIDRADMIDDERFATNGARVRNRPALLSELRHAFAAHTTSSALELLTSNGLVAGRISTYTDLTHSDDVKATGILIDTHGALGAIGTVGTPYSIGTASPRSSAGAPALGEHTAEILAELGVSLADAPELSIVGASAPVAAK